MGCLKCNTNKCTCETTICINPLIHLFKEAFALNGTVAYKTGAWDVLMHITGKDIKTPDPAIYDLPLALIYTLTQGITISNNMAFCCPDCKNGIYFLGSANNYLTVSQNDLITLCCVEHYSSVEVWNNIVSNGYDLKCCNTDFSENIMLWISAASASTSYFTLDQILDLGVFESSSFNGFSGLGILFNYLQINHPELTADDYLNILGVIVNLGIVVQCYGCNMIISSTDTYMKWINKNGKAYAKDATAKRLA